MAKRSPGKRNADEPQPTRLRVIGGHWRGRTLQYSGDLRTRPMKDRVREALFNLLGNDVRGAHALDLFAGTGALGIEALSRGAVRATFIERHLPTAKLIGDNIASLDATDRTEVLSTSAFLWGQKHAPFTPDQPLLILCSPPFDFFVERREEMLKLIAGLWREAPAGSVLAIEADERFDFVGLPADAEWDIRPYPPAMVGIGRR